MSAAKRNVRKTKRRKANRLPEVVVVIKTVFPASKTSFPEKVKKGNEILSKIKFLPTKTTVPARETKKLKEINDLLSKTTFLPNK